MNVEGIFEPKDDESVSEFRLNEGEDGIYMEEIGEQIREQKNNKRMKDINEELEMKLNEAYEMELLRMTTSNLERETTSICKDAQDQLFNVIETCKHSVYVNNVRVCLKFIYLLLNCLYF